MMKPFSLAIKMGAATAVMLILTGCHVDMWRQDKVKPQARSDFFADQQASRLPVAHTVAAKADDFRHTTDLRVDNPLYNGFINGKLVEQIPIQVDKEALLQGQKEFNIYCSPCHGRLGDGRGMIALRGLSLKRPPASYHTDRLRKMPIGHFFDVITNGYGIMYSYAARVQDAHDRWKIAAYIRALQLSQNASPSDVSPEELQKINAPAQPSLKAGNE